MNLNKLGIGLGILVFVIIAYNVKSGELGFNDAIVLMQENSLVDTATETVSNKIFAGEEKELKILAFGDMMLGRYVRILMDKNGANYPFEKLGNLSDIFSEDEDVIFANLEGPIKGDGIRSETSMTFGFPEYTADLIKDQGFNVVSLANNHTSNMGTTGYESTKKLLDDRGIGYCGEPVGAFERSVYYGKTEDGSTYAFLCFHSAISDLDYEEVFKIMETVRPNVDFLIVSMHWGSEYKNKPNENTQVVRGHELIDHGADLVIGHHPHVVEPYEIYKDRYVFYSLGNFIFDQYWSAETQKQLAAGIVLKKNDKTFSSYAKLFPMISERSQPRLMTKEEYSDWAAKIGLKIE